MHLGVPVNTKLVMTVSSLVLGLAGLFLLFAPQEVGAAFGVPLTNPLPVLVQLAGALYLSLALMNWTAKDSVISGVYALQSRWRISPTSLSARLCLPGHK